MLTKLSKFLGLLCITISVCKSAASSQESIASKYDGNCLRCIANSFHYCNEFLACQPKNVTCPRGASYNITTGCPVQKGCPFGANGVAYIGNTTVEGG